MIKKNLHKSQVGVDEGDEIAATELNEKEVEEAVLLDEEGNAIVQEATPDATDITKPALDEDEEEKGTGIEDEADTEKNV